MRSVYQLPADGGSGGSKWKRGKGGKTSIKDDGLPRVDEMVMEVREKDNTCCHYTSHCKHAEQAGVRYCGNKGRVAGDSDVGCGHLVSTCSNMPSTPFKSKRSLSLSL